MINSQRPSERNFFFIDGQPAAPPSSACHCASPTCPRRRGMGNLNEAGMGALDPNSGEYIADQANPLTEWLTANWKEIVIAAAFAYGAYKLVEGWKGFQRTRKRARAVKIRKRIGELKARLNEAA